MHDFKDIVSGIYLPLLTVTSVSYKTIDTGTYSALTEGQELDYTVDLPRNAIFFNFTLQRNGYKNLKFTGTGAKVYSAMTSMDRKYKIYIALLASIKGVVYASGGTFEDVKSSTVGNITTSKGEFQVNYAKQLEELKRLLDDHEKAYGLRRARSNTVVQ